jgi:hypothetical protein
MIHCPPVSSARPGPLVAYDAASLDKSVRRYVGVAERNIELSESVSDQLPALLEKLKTALAGSDEAFEDTERLSIVYDRFVKAGLNLVKAVDELSRLRSFLSGGPDSRPDLSSMSEVELRQIVVTAVRALGITDLRQIESASA